MRSAQAERFFLFWFFFVVTSRWNQTGDDDVLIGEQHILSVAIIIFIKMYVNDTSLAGQLTFIVFCLLSGKKNPHFIIYID